MHTCRQEDRHADRQTGRQTHTLTHRNTDQERETDRHTRILLGVFMLTAIMVSAILLIVLAPI